MREADARFGEALAWAITACEIEVEEAPQAMATDERAEAEWARLLALNPRLFDGSILAAKVVSERRIAAYCESYKRFRVQRVTGARVELLAVTGVLMSRGADGSERVLLCRRGESTFSYAGLWEIGPSGALDPGPERFGLREFTADLDREVAEELGVRVSLDCSIVALTYDGRERSWDVVVRAEVPESIAAGTSWECTEARWVPVGDIADFESRHGVIEPSRALFRLFGWA